MSVLVEIIITSFFTVLMSTEEVKNEVSETIRTQEQVAELSKSENCE